MTMLLSDAAFTMEPRRRWVEKHETGSVDELLATIPEEVERGSVFVSNSHPS